MKERRRKKERGKKERKIRGKSQCGTGTPRPSTLYTAQVKRYCLRVELYVPYHIPNLNFHDMLVPGPGYKARHDWLCQQERLAMYI